MTDHKAVVVSVAEMARQCGLSRARFYQLIGTTFPWPVYDLKTRRPYYTEELQQVCLEVRRRNCGVDGRPVLFYARRTTSTPAAPRRTKRKRVAPANDRYADLIDGLRSLGLVAVTPAQAETAIKELYPSGTDGIAPGEVLRAVFLSLKAQGSAG